MTLRTSWLGGCAGLALLTSGPALAVGNLSGTYEGKRRCETTTAGVVTRTKQDGVVEVADGGNEEGVLFEVLDAQGATIEDRIIGLVIQDAVRAEIGTLPAASCDYESFDKEGLVARLAVRTKLGTDKAGLKGTLLRSSIEDATSSVCTLDVKRVSTELPDVTICVHVEPI
jgi:hypothetical protein